jgi:phosphopantetheinyl transferase
MYFTLWTCKEAYLKTLGTGFSVSPETVEITLDVEAVPRWIEMPSPQKPWAFYRISLPHCAAALGVCNLEHASIQTSAIYVHATNGGKRRALENVEPSWPN